MRHRRLPGKNRASLTMPRIPVQSLPTHDTDQETPERVDARPADTETRAETQKIPQTGRWKASHVPRTLAIAVLVMAVLSTAMLGVQSAQSQTSDNFVSLMIGLGVVVVLWALVIASTPQVVTLDGSVLTVRNTGGSERFDLADGQQRVGVVGDPRTPHWAVLLDRPDGTTRVLRRNDVIARELDPIVRHYRLLAEQFHAQRDARFNH